MNTVELAKTIENSIKLMLAGRRFSRPENYVMSRLYVYDHVVKFHSKNGIITTGFFSRIVGDMKRTGIIGTAKGGEVLFLTDAYWKMTGGEEQLNAYREKREKLAIEIIRHIEAAPRTREYFRGEDFYEATDQNMVDHALQFFCDEGSLKLEEGLYQLSDRTRAAFDAQSGAL